MKFWTSNTKGDDKIIVYHENTLYRINPKNEDLESMIDNLNSGVFPYNTSTGIPLSYIKQINMEESKEYIEVLFGKDSSEHLRIQDSIKRNELFEHLKSSIKGSQYKIDNYSKIRAGKKPLIAMCVVIGIFLWTYNISLGIEQGVDYRLIGSHQSLATIVLMIASIGSKKVAMIFGSLFIIAFTSFIIKIKNPKVVHKIIVR